MINKATHKCKYFIGILILWSSALWADSTIQAANHDPVLSMADVIPATAECEDQISFIVRYIDEDGDLPAVHQIYIGQTPHDMFPAAGSDPRVGISYLFQIFGHELGGGCYDYFFYFEDGQGGFVIDPPSGRHSGPCVESSPDVLVTPLTIDMTSQSVSETANIQAVEYNSLKSIDLKDPNSEIGPVSTEYIIVRLKNEKVASFFGQRLGIENQRHGQWASVSTVFENDEVIEKVTEIRPFKAGAEKALKFGRGNKSVSAQLLAGTALSKETSETISAMVKEKIRPNGPMGLFYMKIRDGADPREVSLKLMDHKDVIYAHPSPVYQIEGVPNDSLYERMWNLNRIGMASAWDISGNTHGSVSVCVIDTGVRISHDDFVGRTANEVDVYGANGDAYGDTDTDNDDLNGHGTAVAGIIGAIRDNGVHIAGIAPVTIIPVNASSGGTRINNYIDGVYWGVDHGARVINMSFGEYKSGATQAELDAANYAEEHDVIVCAAAGNDDGNADNHYPSAIPYYISVAAVDDDDVRVTEPKWWWGSNFGDTVDICAPGQGNVGSNSDSILTLDRDSDTDWTNSFNGTSAATPHVSGLCALIAQANPSLTGLEIRGILESTAEDQIGDPSEDTEGWDPYHGHGLVNAFAALTEALGPTTRVVAISNEGCGDPLTVTSIIKERGSFWLSFEPIPPFDVAPNGVQHLTVRADLSGLVPNNYSDRLIIHSNDGDESPYPGGVQVNLTVVQQPEFETTTNAVTVPEGGSAGFQVRLNAQPLSTVSATVSRVSGDGDITVSSGTSLTFTTSNWSTYQPVTLTAAEDADVVNGVATIRVSASGIPDEDVTATESDDDTLIFETTTNAVTVPEGGSAGFQVRLNAQPLSTVSATVSRVSGDGDITVSSGTSLTFTTSNWSTYQPVTLTAAEDADVVNGVATIRVSASGIPDEDVTATESDDDTLIFETTTNAVTVPEGGSAGFQVRLNAQPLSTVSATVSRVSGDGDITVSSGTSLTFTTSNWSTYQPVTLTAAEDADVVNGVATIRVSASGIPDEDVTATESDDDTLIFETTTNAVTVPEGGSAGFQVRLNAQPLSTVSATVSRVSGDGDITVFIGNEFNLYDFELEYVSAGNADSCRGCRRS